MGGTTIQDLLARLRLDTSGFQQGLRSAQSSLSQAGAGMRSAGAKASVGVTLPLLGAAAASVKLAGDFDQTMRQVAIATGGPTKALQELALKMGADTKYSAGEAGDAMLELAKGGMTAAQIQGGALQSTLKLASAGGVELADASTYVSNSMATFGLRAKDANSVAVALAGGANASSASVQSLGQGLAQGALAAKGAGLSLQDTVGVLSEFDAAGLKGADAGTSLKSALNSLTPSTTKARDAMKDLGLNFTNADGSFKSIGEVAQNLQDKLGGLTEVQRAQALETIFGSDGARAAAILMDGGAKAVDRYTKATRDSKTTNELANASMQGVNGAVEAMSGSIETAGILIGQTLAPYVQRAAVFIGDLANRFGELNAPTRTIIIALGAIAAAIGPVLVVLGVMASGIGVVSGAFAALGGAWAAASAAAAAASGGVATLGGTILALLGPVGIAVAVIAAIVAGFVLLYTRSETVRTAVASLGAGMVAAFQAVLPIVLQVVAVFRAQLPQVAEVGRQAFSTLVTVITAAMSIIRGIISVGVRVLIVLWRTFGPAILGFLKGAMAGVISIIRGALNIVQGVIRTVMAVIHGDWAGAWRGIQQVLRGVWQVIGGIVRVALAALRGLIQAGWAAVKGLTTAAWQAVVTVITAAWGRARDAVSTGIGKAVDLVKSLPGKILAGLGNLGSVLFNAGAQLISGLVSGITSKIGAAVDAVQNGLSKIKGLLPGSPIKWGPLKGWNDTGPRGPGGQLMGRLADGIDSGSGRAAAAMTRATAAIHNAYGNGAKGGWTLKELQHLPAIRKWRQSSERAEMRDALDKATARVAGARSSGHGLAAARSHLRELRDSRDALRMDVMDLSGRYTGGPGMRHPYRDGPQVNVPVTVHAPQATSPDTLGGIVGGRVAAVITGRGHHLVGGH